MTAANVMDIISRLPGCAGQAADAVSAYTQVKMEGAPTLLKIPESECPDVWIRLPKHKWPKSLSSMEDPVIPLERKLYGHPLAGLSRERQFEKVQLKYGWRKVSNCECLFFNLEKGLFFSVYVDDIKIGWEKAEHQSNMEDINERRRFGLMCTLWASPPVVQTPDFGRYLSTPAGAIVYDLLGCPSFNHHCSELLMCASRVRLWRRVCVPPNSHSASSSRRHLVNEHEPRNSLISMC